MTRPGMSIAGGALTSLALIASGAPVVEETAPIEVRLTIPAKNVMAGEPILVEYELVNLAPDKATMRCTSQMLRSAESWITFETRTEDGRPVRPISGVGARGYKHRGLDHEIGAGSTARGLVVAGPRAMPRSPGNYNLIAQVKFNYYPAGRIKLQQFVSQATVPLHVIRGERKNLRPIAERLAQSLLKNPIGPDADQNIDALLSMPEVVALPYWRALAADERFREREQGRFGQDLSGLNSVAAATLLADLWATVSQKNPEGDGSARTSLVAMRDDPSCPSYVRTFINRIFLQREGRIPEPLLPKNAIEFDGG